MAAARNVSAAARITDAPFAGIAAGQLADRGGLARPVDADDEDDRRAAGHRSTAASSRGRAGPAVRRARRGWPPRAHPGRAARAPARPARSPGRPDVAGDQRLLDLVPGRAAGLAAAEQAAQPRHEPAARPLESGAEVAAGRAADGGSGVGVSTGSCRPPPSGRRSRPDRAPAGLGPPVRVPARRRGSRRRGSAARLGDLGRGLGGRVGRCCVSAGRSSSARRRKKRIDVAVSRPGRARDDRARRAPGPRRAGG